VSTSLHDLMHRAVEDTAPDLGRISTAARRRGLAIRRRRQALSAVGAATAVVVIVVGAGQLGGLTQHEAPAAGAPRASESASTPASPTPVRTVPITGRATVAGLISSVSAVAPGTPSALRGQGSADSSDTYGEMRWDPPDGTGISVIGINVQPAFQSTEIYRCRAWQVSCRVIRRAGGATLMTYEEHTPTAAGDGIRAVADLFRTDGVRVVASSTNGIELPASRWRLTRTRPYLSTSQLYRVVAEPWWGPTIDARLQQAGQRLHPYEDLTQSIK
jgi:hypothetical protein